MAIAPPEARATKLLGRAHEVAWFEQGFIKKGSVAEHIEITAAWFGSGRYRAEVVPFASHQVLASTPEPARSCLPDDIENCISAICAASTKISHQAKMERVHLTLASQRKRYLFAHTSH